MHLGLDGGCRLRGALLIGSLGIPDSKDLKAFPDSLSFSDILSASLFMDLMFFLLNLALVLLDALVILSSKASMWDFRLSISASRLMNSLASLESLAHLHLSCLLFRLSGFSLWFPLRFPSRHLWGWQWRSLGLGFTCASRLMFVILEKSY